MAAQLIIKLVGFLLLLIAAASVILPAADALTVLDQAKEGCQDRCGNVSIPYPFGTNNHCSLSPDFLVTCNHSSNPPKLLLGEPSPEGDNIPVLNISLEGELLILNYVSHDCRTSSGSVDISYSVNSLLTSGWFNISSTRNKFTMVGCDTDAWIQGQIGNETYRSGCMSLCGSISNVRNGSCSGNGCCQTSIPEGLSAINLTLNSFNNYSKIWDFDPCGHAFVVEESHFNFSSNLLKDLKSVRQMPLVFDWAFGHETCQVEDVNNQITYSACMGNSTCNKRKTGWGYLCNCSEGYQGNPYLHPGCLDKNECEDSNLNMCEHPKTCVNIPGNHTCSCPKWYHGDGRTDGEGCTLNHLQIIHAAIGIGVGLAVSLIGSTSLCWALKKRRFIKLKKKYFQQNGGSELKQQLSSQGSNQRIKFFTTGELEKATKNFDESNIIGQGGFGTVYKGTLTDGRIVAIKKYYKVAGESQGYKDFINEVGILSQINHRHVIQLLGCCLETPLPLLVYELINNGTLSDHIHDENKASSITWETRLKIASQTAEALYYLHSKASIPIIHRDVKSTNILLDEDYDVKVCDFGASRVIKLEQTQLSTAIQGTPGYLDPESMQTNQVTDKSDVYSFGVVLVELLTGKKALFFDRPKEQRILTMFFLFALKDDSLFEVLEDSIVNDGNHLQISKVAHIAKKCLNPKGEERPTMKEVVVELEIIRMIGENVTEQSPEDTSYLLEESSAQYYLGNGESSTATHSMVGSFLLPISDAR